MRKILIAVLSIVLALSVLCFIGCGSEEAWKNPNFAGFGEVKTMGGFVADTENYVLFINGDGNPSADNSYGTPVKGSLMAIKKSDLAAGKYSEAKIVVPKLFVAKDFNAGLFISGDYVYFGTPSTAKNSSGAIANDVLVFTKAKIDGSEKPVELFSVPSLSTEYGISEKDGNVYIVYYEEPSLKVFNATTKAVEVIATKDDKTNGKVGNVYPTLDSYKFVKDSSASVLFTVKVFTEEYFSEKAEKDGYSRETASYNYVYSYSAGDVKADGDVFVGKKILSDANGAYSVSLSGFGGEYLFYKTTDVNSKEKNYAIKLSELSDLTKAQEIINADLVADTSLIISLEEVYCVDSDSAKLVKASFVGEARDSKIKLCDKGAISKLLFKDGESLYYISDANEIMRKNLSDLSSHDVRISVGTVVTQWYAPEIVRVEDKNFMFYCDNTTVGSSYIYCIDLASSVVEKDTDDDGTNDLFYLEYSSQNDLFIGVMTAEDDSNKAVDAINAIGTTLELEEDANGELFSKKLNEAKKVYEGLSDKAKGFVAQTYITKLENAEKSVKLANLYAKLKGVQNYGEKSEEEKSAYKTAYNSAKAYRQELIGLDEGSATYIAVRDMVTEELKYYFQEAVKVFDPATEK